MVHMVIMVLKMLTVHNTRRHGFWEAISVVLHGGFRNVGRDQGSEVRDRKKKPSGSDLIRQPEARVPYEFGRIKGPGGVF